MQFKKGQSVALFRRGKITGRGVVEKTYANGGALISLGRGRSARVGKTGIESGGFLSAPLSVEGWDAEVHAPKVRALRARAALASLMRKVDDGRDKIPTDKLDEALALAHKLARLVPS